VRDYVREEKARDYATGLAWGLSAGSWGSSGYASGSGYDSGYGSGYGSGTGYGTTYSSGYGSGSGDAYASASSTASDAWDTTAAQETSSDSQQDAAAAHRGDQATDPGPDGTKTASDSAAQADRGYQVFDRARDAFRVGNYAAALDRTDEALKDVPDDLLVQEFKALVLFARGEYAQAADVLHAVLAVGPGMNWTTLSGLYPDVAIYTGQLRVLEGRCRQDAKAAAPHFVLAYHYLVAGHKDAAVAQLKAIVALQPDDTLSARLLAQFQPSSGLAPTPAPAETIPAPVPAGALPGTWKAAPAPGATITFAIKEDGGFTWTIARPGKPPTMIAGTSTFTDGVLTLTDKDHQRGTLAGKLAWQDSNHFTLRLVSGPAGGAGLRFAR
jgi:hypothetical protein